MNRPTQYIVNVDFAEKSINKIIGDIYNQLDLSLYVPYANLDGLDDLLYPDDFDGPITFIIQNPSDVNTRDKQVILEILKNKSEEWRVAGKKLMIVI